ncbi:receptor-like protein EIX1 [Quercus robur]|uniref:receptor-like protein EIX1 n=1 Tax=Quercus robur TaxID=38942 RepID=UPI002163A90B|nr:receptor-like protein EIX1 [Quercus robur]
MGNEFRGSIPDDFTRINSLAHLHLDSNKFEGEVPKAFGGICHLKTLSLSGNYLNGQLDFIQNLTECANPSLEVLFLSHNQIMHLNGTIPVSLGKLSNLESLILGFNPLKGVISEAHFSNLTKLKHLGLSNTKLVFNFSSDWSPPFQLDSIDMKSCQVGPRFPKWLQNQKNIQVLDISNSSISDTLSDSNWIFSSQLIHMNLSHNQLSGHVPNLSWDFSFFPILDLSSNKLEGEIPRFLFKAAYLDLSKNMFSKQVRSLCTVTNENLNFLDLSNNQLSGELPDCWMQFEALKILNLANNQFHGKIPSSVGSLHRIETLDLSNNSFSGELPLSLKNCTKLKFINLQNNNLLGEMSIWLGSNHPNLIVLLLRSNRFFGSIPSHLCHLTYLQVLDLALNQISGSIPICLKNIIALTQKCTPNSTITHS